MEQSTDVFPLTAYCDHPDCIADSYYTYRYYEVDGEECPALYYDPLIIVGGDKRAGDSKIPNYQSKLYHHFTRKYVEAANPNPIMMNALRVSCIAEKALLYIFSEENIISAQQMEHLVRDIKGDESYINERLMENRKIQISDFAN
jgi:thymidine kinase